LLALTVAAGCAQAPTSLRIEVALGCSSSITSLNVRVSIDGGKATSTDVTSPTLPGAVELLLPDRAQTVGVELVAIDAKMRTFSAMGSKGVTAHQQSRLTLMLAGNCMPPNPDAAFVPPDFALFDAAVAPDMQCTPGQLAYCTNAGCTSCLPGGFCAGGYCAGNGCAAQDTSNCGVYGCYCVNGGCSGGNCMGTGCTNTEVHNCALMGCDCADGQCSGGACPGDACTELDRKNCGAYGCGCAFHMCHGGACP
jgi:hypothetical protein